MDKIVADVGGVSGSSAPPSDQAARRAIVGERRRNVSVVAGAGTGKTKTIIDRAIDLLAPRDDRPAIPITRVAAITFTRRAAGELRFRLRERLLSELKRTSANDSARIARLSDALSNLDAAFIGTIHGFADRLLRLRPVEAQLSPAYVLVEDNSELVHETFLRLRRSAETGTLSVELGRHAETIDAALLTEAAATLRAAGRAGLQMERRDGPFGSVDSVEAMLAGMVETRDVAVPLAVVPDPALSAARDAATRADEMRRRIRGDQYGHRRLRRAIHFLQRVKTTDSPAEAVSIVAEVQGPPRLQKERDFSNDETAWSIYKALRGDHPKSLGAELQGPHRWLAARLVRLFPIVAAMYERVKDEHEVVDYLDLLIKLRNLLRDDVVARQFYQARFDHIFVDEFQDTDPLQCEIVFYLCERGAAARDWSQVELTAGKLTIVGDPKQSIYRFRRADIAMYGRAVEQLVTSGALEERLETNFRSRPELIDFFNTQLAAVLGEQPDEIFDPAAGRAYYEPLRAAQSTERGGACVHLLPYADAAGEGLVAGTGRVVEGAAVAHYVRWLLTNGYTVRDVDTNTERPIRPGDIAVLAPVTTHLRLLLERLDDLGIEYTARGGVLFLGHPTVRRYLLALRALADRDDGVAQAALLQPPFFAVDWADVRAPRGDAATALTAARQIVENLRARRHSRSPGATARDVIELTAFGRYAATARNGRQLLATLYEVATELDRRAGLDGLDFDAATELVRNWADTPVHLEAPEPLSDSAVRVLTIHQAKGLEFPVVVLWDGFQRFTEPGSGVWKVDRLGQGWALRLGQIAVEHPVGCGLLQREREFGEHERRRLYYVAATRARDLLVLPLPRLKSDWMIPATRKLATGVDEALVREFATFSLGRLPEWAQEEAVSRAVRLVGDDALQERIEGATARLHAAAAQAMQPRSVPTAVTTEAGENPTAAEGLEGAAEWADKVAAARYGPAFGLVVHRALEQMLSSGRHSNTEAVQCAATEVGAVDHLGAAAADVDRTLTALQRHGLDAAAGWSFRTEYSVCIPLPGKLMSGVIDLLAVRGDEVVLIDFKTDSPHGGRLAISYPVYAAQLRLYEQALRGSGWLADQRLRSGLLFTATGELRWLD